MFKGITIQLSERTEIGHDEFNAPVYRESYIDIENILVSPVSSTEQTDILNMTGTKVVYEIAIPKDDDHEWENQLVKFFGKTWRCVGIPTEGIPDLIPGPWNRKVKVERYE